MSRRALDSRASTLGARPGVPEPSEGEISSERPPWWRRYRLAIHTAVLVALVLAIAPLTLSSGVGWIDDEGAYALQVEALLDGSWDYGYWAADFDPEARWKAITRADVDGEHLYPYVKHPVYVVLLAGGAWLFGTGFGLYAVPMLGLVLAAVVSWFLAEEFEPRAGPIAFWLVAGSPLLIDAYALYAHTLGAAVAGMALLVAVRILRHGLTWRRCVAFAAMLSLGGLLRSEALLFGTALTAAVVGALAWRARRERLEWERALRRRGKGRKRQAIPDAPHPNSRQAAAWVGGAGIVSVVAAVLFERVLVRSIVGTASAASSLGNRDPVGERTVSEFLEGKLDAAWRITFSGSEAIPAASEIVVAAVMAAVVVALLGRIFDRGSSGWALLLGGAGLVSVLYFVRVQSYRSYAIPGFFAAWPVAVAGLAWLPWRRRGRDELTTLAGLLAFAALVYATQYDIGGAVEWGGRFLALAVPGMAAVVAAGVLRRWTGRRTGRQGRIRGAGRARWAGVVFLATVLLVPAASGVAILHRHRLMNRPFHDDVAAVATQVVVIASNEPVHYGFPKLSWTLNEDHDFLLTLPGKPAVELLETLYQHGFEAVTVIHSSVDPIQEHSPFSHAEDVTPLHTRSIGGAIHVLSTEGRSRGQARG